MTWMAAARTFACKGKMYDFYPSVTQEVYPLSISAFLLWLLRVPILILRVTVARAGTR
jgi:hypothetical protein